MANKIVDMSSQEVTEEVKVETPIEEVVEVEKVEEKAPVKKAQRNAKPAKIRGKNYLMAKDKVDREKNYSIDEAISLLKETKVTKFEPSAELHLVTNKKGMSGEVALPYYESKDQKVEVATDETLAKLDSGKIDFDVLLATPQMMPKLAKYAKMLGPKGLMPNPKTGTIVEDPQKAMEKFQKSSFKYKGEASAPLIHTVFGKLSQKDEELKENLLAILKAVGSRNIQKATINTTMGPGIKITVDKN